MRQEGDLKFLYKLKVDESALKKRNINPKLTEYRKETITAAQIASGQALQYQQKKKADTAKVQTDIFESEFDKEKLDTILNQKLILQQPKPQPADEILKDAKLYDYSLKFFAQNFTAGFNNDVLATQYQPFTGALPIMLGGNEPFNAMFKAAVFDLFEDIRFTGALRLPLFGGSSSTAVSAGTGGIGIATFNPTSGSFFDGGGQWYARVDYLKLRTDFSLIYYRETDIGTYPLFDTAGANSTHSYDYVNSKLYTNLFQAVIRYPFDKIRSLRYSVGVRTDKIGVYPNGESAYIPSYPFDTLALKSGYVSKQVFLVNHLEYVFDNTIVKTMNIMNGLRYKFYVDLNYQINTATNRRRQKDVQFRI